MKTWLIALFLASMLLTSTGCAFHLQHPIEETQNILVAGVDIEDGQIKLTLVADQVSAGGPAGETKVSTQVYSAMGDTIFEAARSLRSSAEKILFWYHLKYVVIGEKAAKEDIKGVLDFFTEHDENRLLHKLIVTKGMSAAEFFTKVVTKEDYLWDNLDTLFKATELTGESTEVRLLDYVRDDESEWRDSFIPTVEVIPSEQQNPGYLVKLSGYALFKDNRLAGYLDGRQALGLNIVNNKIESAQITVTDMRGRPVTLEVVSSKADIKTDLSDKPSATISIVIHTFMAEYHETAGATKDEYLRYLETQQNNYVMNLIAEALTQAQRCGSDVFGIGDALYHAHPVDSERIRDNWNELYPVMSISIQVESVITGTYNMNDAMGK